MLINKIKDELNCHANDFQELLSSQKDVSVSFKQSDLQFVMKSQGSVEIKQASIDVKYQLCKIQQAQCLQQQIKLPSKFLLDVRFSVPYSNLVGISVSKDNRLFVCNHFNSSLFVMSDKGKTLETVQMDGKQWGIAMEEDKNTVWVTLPQKQSVQSVDMLTMKKRRLIKVPSCDSHLYVYGIAIIDEQIAVGGFGKIHIISKTGDLKKSLEVGKSLVYSISVGHTHQLYYAQADTGKSTLKSVKLDGTIASICAEGIENMTDFKSDKLGNVYILESTSSNLKLFSFENKSLKTILTSKDGLKGPYGLAFSKDFSKLFISNCTAGEILVFLCNQK
ncbi:uncharacterized protein LOC127713018 [Mytilus californianus]|uniref:uncharacterized protein LOC127713018 n=1 Tax=Mytilus californianus TaxID=6549 RepID=UPI00224709CE|nr:uncharacterized protein LOC127713018 [Mytilus californianus]